MVIEKGRELFIRSSDAYVSDTREMVVLLDPTTKVNLGTIKCYRAVNSAGILKTIKSVLNAEPVGGFKKTNVNFLSNENSEVEMTQGI